MDRILHILGGVGKDPAPSTGLELNRGQTAVGEGSRQPIVLRRLTVRQARIEQAPRRYQVGRTGRDGGWGGGGGGERDVAVAGPGSRKWIIDVGAELAWNPSETRGRTASV